jgi:hypothetical protein
MADPLKRTPRLSKTPAAAKPANVTKPVIEEYLQLEADRKEHARQAYLLEKRTKGLAAKLKDWILANAPGKTRSVDRSGFRLSIVEGPGYPSWKAEFVNALGQDEADAIAAACPPSEKLQVIRL